MGHRGKLHIVWDSRAARTDFYRVNRRGESFAEIGDAAILNANADEFRLKAKNSRTKQDHKKPDQELQDALEQVEHHGQKGTP